MPLVLIAGCNRGAKNASEPTVKPQNLPKITAVELAQIEVPNYQLVEFFLEVAADFDNPYNQQEVSLDGQLVGPDGSQWVIPGFWDGEESWRIRFTPSQVGEWTYELAVTDQNGTSLKSAGNFFVTPSDHHGWLQVGNWVDPSYSSHYLVYHDGTPFYGVGHAEALNILVDGFSVDGGVGLFNNMVAAGENYVVWWPFYTNSPVNPNYDDYSVSNLNMIELVVADAQKKGVFLIFTIWDHPQLRDETHDWGDGRWGGYNGFRKLTSLDEFFTSYDSWIWQENLYRYLIARWGYSPAIGMWQTVSEINGTNAYSQTNTWHAKINDYFAINDPYRHPTTASMSGDVDWPAGHAVMDIPQVHVYALDHVPEKDVVGAAAVIAAWTELMWPVGKPNWIGEFGVQGNRYYPELYHNSIWAALAAGAAMIPAEWNSTGPWMQMSEAMYADTARLAEFVADIPLAAWNPSPLTVISTNPALSAWGLASREGGLIWVQDVSLAGETIDTVRASQVLREKTQIDIADMPAGAYKLSPYNTWDGEFLPPYEVVCVQSEICTFNLPDFYQDIGIFSMIRG